LLRAVVPVQVLEPRLTNLVTHMHGAVETIFLELLFIVIGLLQTAGYEAPTWGIRLPDTASHPWQILTGPCCYRSARRVLVREFPQRFRLQPVCILGVHFRAAWFTSCAAKVTAASNMRWCISHDNVESSPAIPSMSLVLLQASRSMPVCSE
jgi:hypothetical protein